MSEIIKKDDEQVVKFIKSIDKMLDGLETLAVNNKPMFNGERYITDKELSERLKVSSRTSQTWRDKGKIDYVKLEGKVIYAESAVQRFLDERYQSAWNCER